MGKAFSWLTCTPTPPERGVFFAPFRFPLPLPVPGLPPPTPDLPDPYQIYPTPTRLTRPPPDLPDPPPDLPDPPLRVGKPRTPLLRPSQRDFGGRLPHLPDPSLSTFISPFAHSPSPLPIPYPPPFFLYPSVIKERSGRWGSRGKKRPVTAFSRGFSPSPPKKGGRVSRGGGRVKKGGVGKVG